MTKTRTPSRAAVALNEWNRDNYLFLWDKFGGSYPKYYLGFLWQNFIGIIKILLSIALYSYVGWICIHAFVGVLEHGIDPEAFKYIISTLQSILGDGEAVKTGIVLFLIATPLSLVLALLAFGTIGITIIWLICNVPEYFRKHASKVNW